MIELIFYGKVLLSCWIAVLGINFVQAYVIGKDKGTTQLLNLPVFGILLAVLIVGTIIATPVYAIYAVWVLI